MESGKQNREGNKSRKSVILGTIPASPDPREFGAVNDTQSLAFLEAGLGFQSLAKGFGKVGTRCVPLRAPAGGASVTQSTRRRLWKLGGEHKNRKGDPRRPGQVQVHGVRRTDTWERKVDAKWGEEGEAGTDSTSWCPEDRQSPASILVASHHGEELPWAMQCTGESNCVCACRRGPRWFRPSGLT